MSTAICAQGCGHSLDLSYGLEAPQSLASTLVAKALTRFVLVAVTLLLAVRVMTWIVAIHRFVQSSGPEQWPQLWSLLPRPFQASTCSPEERFKLEKAKQLVDEHQLRFWRRGISVSHPFCALHLLIDIVRRGLLGFVLNPPSDRAVSFVIFEGSFPLLVLWFSITWLFMARPSLLTMRNMHLCLTVMIVAWHINLMSLTERVPLFMTYRMVEILYRTAVLSVSNSEGLIYAINGFSFFAVVSMRTYGSCLPGNCIVGYVFQEMAVAITITLISIHFRESLVRQLRATLEAQNSGRFEKAAENLMSSMCDAVVHLNSRLEVTRPANLLAALLLKQRDTAMVGHSFLSLLKDEASQTSFRKFIERETEDTTASLHVDMRDSCNAQVRVQLFHAPCQDAFFEQSHIVGVREFCDFGGREGPPGVLKGDLQGDLQENVQGDSQEDPQGPALAPLGETISESSMDRTSPQMPLCSSPELEGEGSVWVDTASDGWPMLKCTPEFITIGGSSLRVGSRLLPWIREGSRFPAQVQATVNEMLESGTTCSSPGLHASFVPKHMPTKHIKATVKLTLDYTDPTVQPWASFDSAPPVESNLQPVVVFTFFDVTITNRRRASREQRANPRRPSPSPSPSPSPRAESLGKPSPSPPLSAMSL